MTQLTLGQAASVLEMSVLALAREIKENKILAVNSEGKVWLSVGELELYRARQHAPSVQELREAGILPPAEIPKPTLRIVPPVEELVEKRESEVRVESPPLVALPSAPPEIPVLPINIFSSYIQTYGAAKVGAISSFLQGYFGEGGSKKILHAEGAGELFNQTPTELERYGKRLLSVLKKIGSKFLEGVPEEYDYGRSPQNFLPGKLGELEKELGKTNGDSNGFPTENSPALPTQDVAELSTKLGLSPDLVRGLIQEGHNVFYLDALVRKGFCLQSLHQFIGGQTISKRNWECNFRRALASYGCRYEPKIKAAEEKLLERIELIIDHHKDSDGPVSFSSKWSSHTRSSPYLQAYLEMYLVPAAKRGER